MFAQDINPIASLGKRCVPVRRYIPIRKEVITMAKSQGNRGGGRSGHQSGGKGGRGRGAGGWPSKTGKPSGGGRTNAPAKGKK